MRNRAETNRRARHGKSDFKYKGLRMEAPPSRISGVVSRLASTGKEVLCAQLTTRGEVISYLGAVEASGELQASVTSTSAWKLRFKDSSSEPHPFKKGEIWEQNENVL